MAVDPQAVRTASPTAMPIIRATITVDDATPYEPRPTASTAATERGVTDNPKPTPKTAMARAIVPISLDGTASAATAPTSTPTTATGHRPTERTTQPAANAPIAVAAASAPSTIRCSAGPP